MDVGEESSHGELVQGDRCRITHFVLQGASHGFTSQIQDITADLLKLPLPRSKAELSPEKHQCLQTLQAQVNCWSLFRMKCGAIPGSVSFRYFMVHASPVWYFSPTSGRWVRPGTWQSFGRCHSFEVRGLLLCESDFSHDSKRLSTQSTLPDMTENWQLKQSNTSASEIHGSQILLGIHGKMWSHS